MSIATNLLGRKTNDGCTVVGVFCDRGQTLFLLEHPNGAMVEAQAYQVILSKEEEKEAE